MTIPLFKVLMAPDASALVAETLRSGYIGEGPRVAEFEEKFAAIAMPGHKALATNSATSAIDLALHLCGVGPGDEVVTTPMTCTATNTHIVLRGAIPVWADIDPETGLIDPIDAGRKTTTKTKAIIAVDWAGRPCDYAALRRRGLPVIEDAAHRLRAPAEHGDYVAFSHQAIKFLTTGDGGTLFVPPERYEQARLLRWYGLDRTSSADFRCAQRIEACGFKYHMNDVAATIGLANLPYAAQAVAVARGHVMHYNECPPPADLEPWIHTVLPKDREAFQAEATRRGIATSQVHARNDHHPAFQSAAGRDYHLPGVDAFSARQVSVPCGWWVSVEDAMRVCELLDDCL